MLWLIDLNAIIHQKVSVHAFDFTAKRHNVHSVFLCIGVSQFSLDLKIVVEMFISRSSSEALLAISPVIKSKCNFSQQTMRIYDLHSHSKQSACFFTTLCCRQAGRVAVSTTRWNGTRVMKSKQADYSEEALDQAGAPREDCTAVKGCIYSRFVFLWVWGVLQCCS